MKKIIILIIAILIAVGIFIAMDTAKGPLIQDTPVSINREDISPAVLPPAEKEGITLSELSQHGGPKDCWIVYKSEVYDVTKFLPLHPGGVARIAQFCGNATTAFEQAFQGQHGASKVEKLKNQISVPQGSLAN